MNNGTFFARPKKVKWCVWMHCNLSFGKKRCVEVTIQYLDAERFAGRLLVFAVVHAGEHPALLSGGDSDSQRTTFAQVHADGDLQDLVTTEDHTALLDELFLEGICCGVFFLAKLLSMMQRR